MQLCNDSPRNGQFGSSTSGGKDAYLFVECSAFVTPQRVAYVSHYVETHFHLLIIRRARVAAPSSSIVERWTWGNTVEYYAG